jgi:hypothetical protein
MSPSMHGSCSSSQTKMKMRWHKRLFSMVNVGGTQNPVGSFPSNNGSIFGTNEEGLRRARSGWCKDCLC